MPGLRSSKKSLRKKGYTKTYEFEKEERALTGSFFYESFPYERNRRENKNQSKEPPAQ